MTTQQVHSKPNDQLPEACPLPLAPAEAEEREIPVAETDRAADQPRKSFDPQRDQELDASLRERGCDAQADSRSCASDERGLSSKIFHARLCPRTLLIVLTQIVMRGLAAACPDRR